MAVLFAFFKALIRIVSWLPFPLLYLLSDLLRFFLQYIFRYRRSVILENLQNSFPEKKQAAIRKIMGKYYRNLADITLEVIKLRSISPETLRKRVDFMGFEHLNKAFDHHKGVIIAIGHCGNWEWVGQALGLNFPVKGYGIIKPLNNEHFNRYLESLRNRFNPKSTISFDFSVVFLDIHRIRRGRYSGEFYMVSNDSKNTTGFEIMEKYIRMLENSINQDTDNWLWSHRRWKNKRSLTEG